MGLPSGRTVPLSGARELIGDWLHFAHQTPYVSVERRMELAEVAAARASAVPKPSWFAIMIKAYSLAMQRHAQLRRSYLTFPWRRLYEHAVSVAALIVERQLADEQALFFLRMPAPENRSLADLQTSITRAKDLPIEQISSFRSALRLMRLPTFLRRFFYWLGLNVSGRLRQQHFGTFCVTGVSSRGAEGLFTIAPLTSILCLGQVGDDQTMMLRVFFDHRVLDAGPVARALAEMQTILQTEILTELRALSPAAPPLAA